MKKVFALTLILALLLGLVPGALAEPAAALEAAALPRVGDVVHGFEVVEDRKSVV